MSLFRDLIGRKQPSVPHPIQRRIVAPKYFSPSALFTFIEHCQEVFELSEKMENGFLLDLSKVKKISMIGVLVIYKIVEFSASHKCFNNPIILLSYEVQEGWKKYGFFELITTYINDKTQALAQYKRLKVSVEDSFIIAPQALLRNSDYSGTTLKEKFLPTIEGYYSESPKTISMIFLCLSEILLNFWEHAVDDSKSIIVAHGTKNQIEIACADTGKGIISTLGPTVNISQKNGKEILKKSMVKGVTSKKNTNHMGYGLWILDEIVTLTKGRMTIYSEGCYYTNDAGKKKVGDCGYWQGTIVYLSLPLSSPKTLADIKGLIPENDLKINWK